MKVLITGSAGFIGSHLVDSQLAHGQYVRAVDTHGGNLEHGTDNQKFDFVLGDITDEHVVEEIVQDINVVYHLASAHLDVSLSENRYRHVNVDGTMILLKAAHSAGVKRLVHCSSVGVMGDERTYERVVALRAVESTDGMTADWVNLPYEFLQETSNYIINRVKGVNRVVYDISSKPPATIEWE